MGEICHIKANSPLGPRYEESQTDNERQGFSNLILMCSNHHTLIDDDLTYTVEDLLSIKENHESRHTKGCAPSDDIVTQLIEKTKASDVRIQLGDGGFQADNITINQGVTVREVRDIADDLFHANFFKLSERAKNEAEDRFRTFRDEIVHTVQETLSESEINRFSDPDVQFKFYEVLQHGVRDTENDYQTRLADLLIQRVKADSKDALKFLYNAAISTASQLSKDQVDLLAFVYLACNAMVAYRFRLASWADFEARYGPMIDEFASYRVPNWNIPHLQSAGCLVVDGFKYFRSAEQMQGDFNLLRHIASNHQMLFQRGMSQELIEGITKRTDLQEKLFTESEYEAGKYVLRSSVQKRRLDGDKAEQFEFRHRFDADLSKEVLEKLYDAWKWALSPLDEKDPNSRSKYLHAVALKNAHLEKLLRHWGQHFGVYSNVDLTCIGMVIAQTHIRLRTGVRFEINPKVL